MTVLLVGAAALLFCVIAMRGDMEWMSHPYRAWRMYGEREERSEAPFIQHLYTLGIDRDVSHATYDQMQRVMRITAVSRFPVRATDELGVVYGLSLVAWDDFDNPDLRYVIWQMAERSGRSLPADWPELDSELRPLRTVADVARWVQELPKKGDNTNPRQP